MTTGGAAAAIRRAAALLREAQDVRRRLEQLTTLATDAPPSFERLLDEALVAVQRLADDTRPLSPRRATAPLRTPCEQLDGDTQRRLSGSGSEP